VKVDNETGARLRVGRNQATRIVGTPIYLGAPMGRAGGNDATLPGGIYKNVWASSRPRPAFPN
jgi:hypothetical protein